MKERTSRLVPQGSSQSLNLCVLQRSWSICHRSQRRHQNASRKNHRSHTSSATPRPLHVRFSKTQWPPRPDRQDPKNRSSDGLWELMMSCWSIEPDKRPGSSAPPYTTRVGNTMPMYDTLIEKDSVRSEEEEICLMGLEPIGMETAEAQLQSVA